MQTQRKRWQNNFEFISCISHELRSKLFNIQEGIDIVLNELAGEINNEQKDYLKIAKSNFVDFKELLDVFLYYQQLKSGKLKLSYKENQLDLVIKKIGQEMMKLTSKKAVEFCIEKRKDLPLVRFDIDRIRQVLTYIVRNAFKIMKGGRIIISSGQENNSVKVSVKCIGTLIKAEKIFNAFSKLETSFEKVSGIDLRGRLELSLSKEIIRIHKGKTWIDRESDKVRIFNFSLPIKKCNPV